MMKDNEFQTDDEHVMYEEHPIEQQLIPFIGDDLAATLTSSARCQVYAQLWGLT